MTLNVSLPQELEARVRAHVASGMYGSASEVIREALRLFEAYHSMRLEDRTALKADVDAGVQDFKDGRVSQIDVNDLKIRARSAKTLP
jgi:antitoxin ParD1/3/4